MKVATARPLPRLALAVVVATCATAGCGSASDGPGADADAQPGRVVRVVDGDTLIVATGGEEERVRLLGIDTPESVKPDTQPQCGSKQAASSLARLAPAGARVSVLTEAATGDVRDDFGRLLAIVTAGGRDLGFEQLRRGWADVYAYRDRRFARRDRYERAYEAADGRAVGVHALCGSDFHRGR